MEKRKRGMLPLKMLLQNKVEHVAAKQVAHKSTSQQSFLVATSSNADPSGRAFRSAEVPSGEGHCSHNQACLFSACGSGGNGGGSALQEGLSRIFPSLQSVCGKSLADFLNQLFIRQAVEAVD